MYTLNLNLHDGIKVIGIFGELKYNIKSKHCQGNYMHLLESDILLFDGEMLVLENYRVKGKVMCYDLELNMTEILSKSIYYPNEVKKIRFGVYDRSYICEIPEKDKKQYRKVMISPFINHNIWNIVLDYFGI